MKQISLALALLLAPVQAFACVAIEFPPQTVAKGDVSIGYVTGEEYPDYEAALIKDGASQQPRIGRHIVRITFVEALEGALLGPMTIETSCYDSRPTIGDRVVVFPLGSRYTVQLITPEYETALRAALLTQHGP